MSGFKWLNYFYRVIIRYRNAYPCFFIYGWYKFELIQKIMNSKDIKEIYAGLKRRHGSKTLLLFRVGDDLVAYLSDAAVVASALNLPLENSPGDPLQPQLAVRFPAQRQEAYVNRLIEAGHAVLVSQEYDSDGNYKIKLQ